MIRSIVLAALTVTVCAAILLPILARVFRGDKTPALSEVAMNGLVDLLKVITGGLIGWLANG